MSLAFDFRAAFPDLFVTRAAVVDWLEKRTGGGDSLDAARADTFARAEEERVECPLCGRRVEVERPRFRRDQALWLLALYSLSRTDYVHISDIQAARVNAKVPTTHNDDYHLLERRGLIEAKEPRSGFWRLTPLGRAFARGRATVPDRVVQCCGKVKGFEGPEVALRHALHPSDFDFYHDVLGRDGAARGEEPAA